VIVLSPKPPSLSSSSTSCNYRVLLIKRSAKAGGFFSSFHAFPGGVVEAADANPQWQSIFDSQQQGGGVSLRQQDEESLDKRVGGLRELFEETGLLLARSKVTGTSSSASSSSVYEFQDIEVLERAREVIHKDANQFLPFFEKTSISPELRNVRPWSRWVTPPFEKKRFDTWFYVAAIDSLPRHLLADQKEIAATIWLSPEEALEAAQNRTIFLPPPTTYVLHELSHLKTISQVLNMSPFQDLRPVSPILVMDQDQPCLTLPGDHLFPNNQTLLPTTSKNRLIPIYDQSKNENSHPLSNVKYWRAEGIQGRQQALRSNL